MSLIRHGVPWTAVFDAAAVVALGLAIAAVWFSLTMPRPLRLSAVTYDRAEYTPIVSLLCTTDLLRYTNRRIVHRAALMTGQRTWYSLDEQKTLIREPIMTTAIEPGQWETTWAVPIPPALPIGSYRMVQVFSEIGAETISYAVPFTLRAC